jgi:CHAT domain-containing protein
VWLLTRDRMHFQRLDVAAHDLRAMTSALAGSIGKASSAVAFRETCDRLYDALIRPLEPRLAGVRTLAIVPDGVLHGVPFPALGGRDGSRLVERYQLAIAPSATAFVAGPRRSAQEPPARVLVVGNPAAVGEGLPNLEAAEREARAIAGEYAQPVLLLRDEATRRRFLDELPAAQVMHFAGHAIASEEYPWLSRLVFAAGDAVASDAAVFAHELREDDIGGLQLAVLAACRSGAGAVPRGEGVLNLARPFIVAGVPFVLVSLWEIDDVMASELFTRFHRAFARSADAVGALAEAQRALIDSGDARLGDPRAWAGYAVIAGIGAGRSGNE